MAVFGKEEGIPTGRHSDFDAQPGSSRNTPAYDRLYDPQGEREFTNLPENRHQIEEARLYRTRNEAIRRQQAKAQEELNRIQFWPDVGRFVIPKENTFAAHLQLVKQGEALDVQFDPRTYLYFDAVIAAHAKRSDLFNPDHKDYAKNAPLRDNIAVIRNDIMGIYMEDGSFDPGDEKYLLPLVEMASDIGDALKNERRIGGIIQPRLDTGILNVEGEGASYLYEYLESRQTSTSWLGNLWAMIKNILQQPMRQWELPPIALSAVSRDKLDIPAPEDDLCAHCTKEQLARRFHGMLKENIQKGGRSKSAVDILTLMEKREAVEHGRTILDWLRNIEFSDKSLKEWMDTGTPMEKSAERAAIQDIIHSYYEVLEGLVLEQPQMLNDPKIREAADTIAVLEHSLQLMAKLEKPKSLADTMQISADITQQPERWDELSGQTVDRLMQTLKGGLEEAVEVIEQQEVDMEEEQEEMVDRHLEAIMHGNMLAMKKKKRKAAAKSGAKQRKIDRDIKADDYVLKQGRFAVDGDEPHEQISTRLETPAHKGGAHHPPSHKEKMAGIDNDMIKALGKTLMQQQHHAKVAATDALQHTHHDDIAPDDQSFTVRQAMQKDRDIQKPGV